MRSSMLTYVHVHVCTMWPAWMHCDCTVPVLLVQIIKMPPLKECPNCKQRNPMRCNKCKYCNADIMKKKRGRPVGTTKSAGYRVGANGGRPCKIAKDDTLSCIVPEQSGKPTTETYDETKGKPSGSKGVGVYKTRGRPMGSTEANGFSVGKSGGRPIGSTECNGFDSSKAGGRPIGTTKLRGFGVGLRGGVYGAQSNMDDIELPKEWDTSSETINIDDGLLRKCASRVSQQRTLNLIVNHLLLGFVIHVVK